MGINAVFILTKSALDDVVHHLKLEDNGPADALPTSNWGAHLNAGWTIVQLEDEAHIARSQSSLKKLSESCDVLVFHAFDTVMSHQLALISKGEMLWRIESGEGAGETGVKIDRRGALPEAVATRLEDLLAPQNAHNLPTEALRLLTSFDYENGPVLSEISILRSLATPTPGLWKDGVRAVLGNLFLRFPKTFMLAAFLALLSLTAVGAIVLGALIAPIIEFLLGDWGEKCLFNCKGN